MQKSTDSMFIPGFKLSSEEQFIINNLRVKFDGKINVDNCIDNISNIDFEVVYNKSVEWSVAPLLYRSINMKLCEGSVTSISDQFIQEMKLTYIKTLLHNKLHFTNLTELLKIFNREGIEAVLLKGIFLAHFVYNDPGERPMGDIDILIKPENQKKVEELLFKMKYHYIEPSESRYEFFKDTHEISNLDGIIGWYKINHHHLLPFTNHNKINSLEIHWAIERPNCPFSIDVSELWRRSTKIQRPGLHALAFSPEDILLHLALQASYQHRLTQGLRPFCDVAAIVNHFRQKIDWEHLQFRARKWGVEKHLYLILRLSHEIFRTKMPKMVLDRLTHPSFDQNIALQAKRRILSKEPQHKGMRLPARVPFFPADENPITVGPNFWDRFKNFFISSKELADRYSIPYPSKRVYFYYLVRFASLLYSYGRVYVSFYMNILIHRKKSANLDSWLAEP